MISFPLELLVTCLFFIFWGYFHLFQFLVEYEAPCESAVSSVAMVCMFLIFSLF